MTKGTKKYHELRQKAIEKLGGCCNLCGVKDNLNFDHIDYKTKEHNIAKLWTKEELFWQELEKCQLLCVKCHKEKTKIELKEIKTQEIKHGTINAYYWRKCRCEACKKAYSVWRRQNRIKNGETKDIRGVYGRPSKCGEKLHYKRGCRCEECKKANAEYERELRNKKKNTPS